MIAGRLNKRITLFEPIAGATASGSKRTEYRATRTVRAERVRLSGRRVEEAGEIFADYSVQWRIRDAHRVAEGWRVQEPGGHIYIVANIEPNTERGFLTLFCQRLNP